MNFSRFYILTAFIALAVVSCRHKKEVVLTAVNKTPKSKNPSDKTPDKKYDGPVQEKLSVTNKEVKSSKLYSFINDWYGTPYKYGGCQKSGVDCSCFTDLLYQNVYGHKTARTAGEIHKECDKINIAAVKEGDLVFFITNGKSISHVGVYLKSNKFAHASTSKGVIISDLNEAYYKKTFHSAGRLKHSLSWKD